MIYVEIENPKRALLVDWMARQKRAREVMVRRRLIPWHVRRHPEAARALLTQLDAAFKQHARDYTGRSP